MGGVLVRPLECVHDGPSVVRGRNTDARYIPDQAWDLQRVRLDSAWIDITERNDLIDRVFVNFAIDSVVALRAEMRGAAFPIDKNRGIGNRFAQMSTGLDVDFKGRRKLLLDPSQGVVKRRVWLWGIRNGPSLCSNRSNVGYVLLASLLSGVQ